MDITARQRDILKHLFPRERSTAQLLQLNAEPFSEDTLQRELKILTAHGLVISEGAGPSRTHSVTALGRMNSQFSYNDIEAYLSQADRPASRYDFDVPQAMERFLDSNTLSNSEVLVINKYQDFMHTLDTTLQKRWRQKWLIEFAWKSSSIEGNTYSELETETLLLDRVEARGKSHYEATMIINHQKAYDHILAQKNMFKTITVEQLLKIHELLVDELDVSLGLRTGPVRISGSRYVPLAHRQQLAENLERVITAINSVEDPLHKAITSLLLISYLQPFADGNKRTARLLANALLEAYDYPPIILGGIDPTRYRRACIAFYEMNALQPMIDIVHDSYDNFIETVE